MNINRSCYTSERTQLSVSTIVRILAMRIGVDLLTLDRFFAAFDGHTQCIWSVAWSPDGRRLASSSGSRIVLSNFS